MDYDENWYDDMIIIDIIIEKINAGETLTDAERQLLVMHKNEEHCWDALIKSMMI